VRNVRIGAPTTALFAVLLTASACFEGAAKVEPLGEPGAAPTPRLIKDLSELSSSKVPNPFERPAAAPRSAAATSQTQQDEPARAFLDAPATVRHVGDDRTPGEQRLSNAKAAQFATFSRVLLDRVFAAAVELELEDNMAKRKLPDNLKPVVLTAILNRDGRLEELIVEQHSGQAVVDNLFVQACQKGLWYENPPKDARTGAGNYQLRIEGRLRNLASSGANLWTFTTYLDLAIM
jgi:hypothetical protein